MAHTVLMGDMVVTAKGVSFVWRGDPDPLVVHTKLRHLVSSSQMGYGLMGGIYGHIKHINIRKGG